MRRDDIERLVVVEPTTGNDTEVVLQHPATPEPVQMDLSTARDRELFIDILERIGETGLDVDSLPHGVRRISTTGLEVMGSPIAFYAQETWRGCDLIRAHTELDARSPGLTMLVWSVESAAGTRTGIAVGVTGDPRGTALDIAFPTPPTR